MAQKTANFLILVLAWLGRNDREALDLDGRLASQKGEPEIQDERSELR